MSIPSAPPSQPNNQFRSTTANPNPTNRYIPGHIHAFYILYVYYSRSDRPTAERAPGIYSERVQNAGHHGHPAGGYGTINNPPPPHA